MDMEIVEKSWWNCVFWSTLFKFVSDALGDMDSQDNSVKGRLLLTLADFSDFSDLNQLLSGLPLADQRTLSMCATYHKRPATRGHVMCHVKLHGGPWRLSCFKLEEIWFTVHGLNPRIWTNTLKCFKTLSQDIQVSPQISLSVHQFISSSFCCGVLGPSRPSNCSDWERLLTALGAKLRGA